MFFNLLTDLMVDQCVLRDSFLISHLLNSVEAGRFVKERVSRGVLTKQAALRLLAAEKN